MAIWSKKFALPPVTLTNICLFAVILFAGAVAFDRLIEFGLKQLLSHSSYRYMRVYADGPPAQYLILGNSRAGVHFPHSTDGSNTYFNLGNGGMGVAYSAALAQDYMDHHGVPKIAIIEMSFISDARYGEDAAGLTRVFSERARAIKSNQTRFEGIAERVFHLINFNHPTLLNAFVGLFWERRERAVATRVNEATLAHIEQSAPYDLTPVPENVAMITKLVTTLRQRGVRVVCVLSPLLKQTRQRIKNLKVFVAELNSICTSNGGLFFNYSAMISDPRLFADSAHLNVDGVRKFQRSFFLRLETAAAHREL